MTSGDAASTASDALAAVTRALPAAEDRAGQREMADLVAAAIEGRRHLVVQAGTGTGKTLAYLVPAITSGKRTFPVPGVTRTFFGGRKSFTLMPDTRPSAFAASSTGSSSPSE